MRDAALSKQPSASLLTQTFTRVHDFLVWKRRDVWLTGRGNNLATTACTISFDRDRLLLSIWVSTSTWSVLPLSKSCRCTSSLPHMMLSDAKPAPLPTSIIPILCACSTLALRTRHRTWLWSILPMGPCAPGIQREHV